MTARLIYYELVKRTAVGPFCSRQAMPAIRKHNDVNVRKGKVLGLFWAGQLFQILLVSKRTCVLQVAARIINVGSDITMYLDMLINEHVSNAVQFVGSAEADSPEAV